MRPPSYEPVRVKGLVRAKCSCGWKSLYPSKSEYAASLWAKHVREKHP